MVKLSSTHRVMEFFRIEELLVPEFIFIKQCHLGLPNKTQHCV